MPEAPDTAPADTPGGTGLAALGGRRARFPHYTLRVWSIRRFSWLLLVVLLFLTLTGACVIDRSEWPAMLGDETTYIMQAASLAYDADLAYTRADYDRFLLDWRAAPENLILQSTDDGVTITFSKPFLYALAVAPFARLVPGRDANRGAVVANALYLAIAALLAASTLERRIGPAAPLWVAVFIFVSVAFAYVFWIHADLFLLAVTAAGLALAFRSESAPQRAPAEIYDGDDLERAAPGWRFVLRWVVVGALLAVPVAFRPFHLAVVLAAALAVPKARRVSGVAALLSGAAALLLGAFVLQSVAGGSWMGYGGERQGFYSYTGYPDVDFPREEWSDSVRRWGNTSWIHEDTLDFEIDARLLGWDALYFLVGQHLGVLLYFPPILLGLAAFGGGRARWALLAAVALVVACFFVIRPFNFWGGAGALANRYFLPLYPVFWFLPTRRARVSWAVVCTLVGGVFLWPLWRQPLIYPLGQAGGYRHATGIARTWLPYETTQSHLKPSGQEDVVHNGLWLKFLNTEVGSIGDGAWLRLSVAEGGAGRLLVGSAEPLESLVLDLQAPAPRELEIDGGHLGEMMLRPDGGVAYQLDDLEVRAVHPMWWTWEPFHLYELRLRVPPEALTGGGEYRFSLRAGTIRASAAADLSGVARIVSARSISPAKAKGIGMGIGSRNQGESETGKGAGALSHWEWDRVRVAKGKDT